MTKTNADPTYTMGRSEEETDTPLMNKLKDWVIEVFERSGAATDMGFGLHRTFVDAGLPAPMMHYEALVGNLRGYVRSGQGSIRATTMLFVDSWNPNTVGF